MMRQFFVLLAVASVALAAVERLPLEPKPEEYQDCEGCWVSEIQQFIPLEETYPGPTGCQGYKCRATEVLILTCGAEAVVPPCYIETDASKPYPGCCGQIKCPAQTQNN